MKTHLHFPRNEHGRDFIVGDIHGMFGMLSDAMARVGFDTAVDRLFSVGDLIDRGPDSHQCLEWLGHRWFHAIRGNHEQMAIDAFNNPELAGLHSCNGGIWFAAMPRCEQMQFVDAFVELPYAIEIETAFGLVGIVHAECPATDWAALLSSFDSGHTRDMCLWSRRRLSDKCHDSVGGVAFVVSGHTILKSPVRHGNNLFIDTGACKKDGYLTLLELSHPLTFHCQARDGEKA